MLTVEFFFCMTNMTSRGRELRQAGLVE